MRKILGLIALLSSQFVWAQDNAEGFQELVNSFFEAINGVMAPILFFEVPPMGLPLILCVMVFGGLFFTFRYGFINVRLFKHAFDVLRGRYDDPSHEGEISHFQALTSALSATVGLGNIAGVAVAIKMGGPGAVFWLWVVAFFGMSMKFSSCTFAQLYREIDSDGKVLGGPMVYLKQAFAKELNAPTIGKILSVFFCIATICAAFGGGNMFQANQTYELLSARFPVLLDYPLAVGVTLAFFAGIVVLGGIQSIGKVTSKMVPFMCVFYCVTCLIIIFNADFSKVIHLFGEIFRQAFNPDAALYGSAVGVFIQGVKRASFSNEAGVGSAAIAHAAAKTDEPVREGVVAMLGPFIDTIVVCTMTALAVLITDAHLDPSLGDKGALITAKAFASLGDVMPTLLTFATVIFAFSTIISYSYYGERAASYLFGSKAVLVFRVVYIFVIICAPMLSLSAVIDFSDLMLLSMAFPNIIGMVFISKKVKDLADDYIKRYKAGSMKVFK